MIVDLNESYIQLNTNFEGLFNVTIALLNGKTIFSETLSSNNKKITLKGFSLHTHTVIISPFTLSL